MKKIILAAMMSAFVAAPLIACDYHKDEATKGDKASLSTEKSTVKASAKAKAGNKTMASAKSKKAKI